MFKLLSPCLTVLLISGSALAGSKQVIQAAAYDDGGNLVTSASVTALQTPSSGSSWNLILKIDYYARPYGPIRPCQTPKTRVYANLILSRKGQRSRVVPLAMVPVCGSSEIFNSKTPGKASLMLSRDSDPKFFDAIFPRMASGKRWYGLQVAFSSDYIFQKKSPISWDSNYGKNYRMVLK